tara:strand:+ start:2421 stop:2969 length:549 start_codon:yes stop_codon:yes gene_type:complete
MAVPTGTTFHGVDAVVNTSNKGSELTNSKRKAYTIEELRESPIKSPAGQNLKLDSSTAIVEVEGVTSSNLDGKIQLNCSQNSHGQKISSQPHSQAASNTLLLPGGTTIGDTDATLVSDTGIQTLSNKSFAGGLQLQVYATTTARDAGIAAPAAGMLVFLTDGDGAGNPQFQGYNGTAWVSLN